ncbi:MAG TPA: methyltransferase [Candidatus Bathyarchaeia archaeon]|nr:methyltransferase [Candidatus Bathyarchaeia archaeon]
MPKIPEKHVRLASEHPLWDRIQIVLVGSFVVVMLFDNVSILSFGYSNILERASAYPIILLPAVFLIAFGVYLIKESHAAVFGRTGKPHFIDSGVYSLVRHPMYLGGLMILLGFLFLKFSLIAFAIWIIYFVLCDWMASYEEKDLLRVLGKEYANYQSRVPKWLVFSKRL